MNPQHTVREFLERAHVHLGGSQPGDLLVHDGRFYDRVMAEGSLGLGESYMDGWWDAEHLDEFFFKFHMVELGSTVRDKRLIWNAIKARVCNMQNRHRSQRVARQHYDISPEFYEDMLGPHMQYTCAYWKRADNLTDAQEQKLDLICRKLQLKKGERLLELGCGWGGFAKFAAANYGCSVVAYNISTQQVEHARRRCAGLPVEIRLCDYREATGTFDKVAAIGICEHVGYKNYRGLMELAHRTVKPHGLVLLHSIGNNASVTTGDPWFDKYIFPGGMLPSVAQLGAAMDGLFVLEDWHNFGTDYDRTLLAWQQNVEQHRARWEKTFDARFFRMWRYYLLSLAGAFRARTIHLWQVVMSKHGLLGGYEPVR